MSNDNNLTAVQEETLEELPATAEELADKYGIQVGSVHSRMQRIRDAGVELSYDQETKQYYPPDEAPEMPHDAHKGKPIDPPDKLIRELRNGGMTYSALAREYEISKNTARRMFDRLREEGYTIDYKVTDNKGTKLFYIPSEVDKSYRVGNGEGHYRFALIGDTHLGSQAEHLDELHDFYDRVQSQGIDRVYHAGDISDGWKVHKGHINAIKGEASGWGRLKEYVVQNYPAREGVETIFIEGNHDHKYHRRNGVHFGELIDNERPDLHYAGDSMARFVFDAENNLDLELIHPSGGKPYTAGYRLQTLFRERPLDQRPTIAGVGHIHGSMYAETEGVKGFYVGAWKGTSTYGKRKGHQASIGGWIIDLEIQDGEVRSLTPQWVGYEADDAATNFSMGEIEEMVGSN